MQLVPSSELRASSDLISDEFQQILSSKYKAAVTVDAMMVEAKGDSFLQNLQVLGSKGHSVSCPQKFMDLSSATMAF